MADIRIISVDSNDTVSLSILKQPSLAVSGVLSLLQAVVVNLMTTPGTDAISPARGAGLMDMARRHRMEPEILEEVIASRVLSVEQRMLQEQRDRLALPASERLASLRLSSLEVSEDDPGQLLVSLVMRVQDGTNIQFSI